ncbi:MAG: hypothetical protein HY077_08720 [Elusimicrobia bacterium]|nr:hypothetical protein [Elusimicrobiota bacterium]
MKPAKSLAALLSLFLAFGAPGSGAYAATEVIKTIGTDVAGKGVSLARPSNAMLQAGQATKIGDGVGVTVNVDAARTIETAAPAASVPLITVGGPSAGAPGAIGAKIDAPQAEARPTAPEGMLNGMSKAKPEDQKAFFDIGREEEKGKIGDAPAPTKDDGIRQSPEVQLAHAQKGVGKKPGSQGIGKTNHESKVTVEKTGLLHQLANKVRSAGKSIKHMAAAAGIAGVLCFGGGCGGGGGGGGGSVITVIPMASELGASEISYDLQNIPAVQVDLLPDTVSRVDLTLGGELDDNVFLLNTGAGVVDVTIDGAAGDRFDFILMDGAGNVLSRSFNTGTFARLTAYTFGGPLYVLSHNNSWSANTPATLSAENTLGSPIAIDPIVLDGFQSTIVVDSMPMITWDGYLVVQVPGVPGVTQRLTAVNRATGETIDWFESVDYGNGVGFKIPVAVGDLIDLQLENTSGGGGGAVVNIIATPQ